MEKLVCESLEEYINIRTSLLNEGQFKKIQQLDEDWKSSLKKGLVGVAMVSSLLGGLPKTAFAGTFEPSQIEYLQKTDESIYKGNFYWEKTDSTHLNKDQIYSATKQFISQMWKSADKVIDNDDKNAGIISVEGITIQKVNFSLATYPYVYSYNVIFRMKDNKYKVEIKNVQFEYGKTNALKGLNFKAPIVAINPFDGEIPADYPKMNMTQCVIPKEKAKTMMQSIKEELNSIINAYILMVEKGAVDTSDDW